MTFVAGNVPKNRRLTTAVVQAILHSRAHPAQVVTQLASVYGITVCTSTVRRIRDNNRWTHISRVGTMWDPNPQTRHPDSPLSAPGYKRRKAKRYAHWPAHLNRRTGKLLRRYRPGYQRWRHHRLTAA